MSYDPRRWLSVSKLKSIGKCGRQYQLERIEKVPSRPAGWTVRGIAAHDTIDTWEKDLRASDPESYYQDSWDRALQETILKFPQVDKWQRTPRVKTVAKDLELRKQDGLVQVQRYCERAIDEEDLWRVKEAEFPFTLEYENFIIRGIIDQVREWEDGDLSLWDLKTGGDDSEDNRQLGVYRHGFLKESGIDIGVGAYWYSKLDRASKSIDLNVYTPEYIEAEFTKLDQIMTQNLYMANPSIKSCFACGVAEHCIERKYFG